MKVVQIGAYKVTIGTDSRRRSLHGTQHNPTFIVNEFVLGRRRVKEKKSKIIPSNHLYSS